MYLWGRILPYPSMRMRRWRILKICGHVLQASVWVLVKKQQGEPHMHCPPLSFTQTGRKSTGRKCLLSSSLMYFLSLYHWSVRIIYKSDHTDILFRYFLCESLTQLSFTLALALNHRGSGFKDGTPLLIHPDCLMAPSYRLQPGHSAVFLAASPSTLLARLQLRLWLRQTVKHPCEGWCP